MIPFQSSWIDLWLKTILLFIEFIWCVHRIPLMHICIYSRVCFPYVYIHVFVSLCFNGYHTHILLFERLSLLILVEHIQICDCLCIISLCHADTSFANLYLGAFWTCMSVECIHVFFLEQLPCMSYQDWSDGIQIALSLHIRNC